MTTKLQVSTGNQQVSLPGKSANNSNALAVAIVCNLIGRSLEPLSSRYSTTCRSLATLTDYLDAKMRNAPAYHLLCRGILS